MTLREVVTLAPRAMSTGARSEELTATQPQLKQRLASPSIAARSSVLVSSTSSPRRLSLSASSGTSTLPLGSRQEPLKASAKVQTGSSALLPRLPRLPRPPPRPAPQIAVYRTGRVAAGAYRLGHRRGPGDEVASGEDALAQGMPSRRWPICSLVQLEPALLVDESLREEGVVRLLHDGLDHHVTPLGILRALHAHRARPAALVQLSQLHLAAGQIHPAALRLRSHRLGQEREPYPFLLRLLHLILEGGHLVLGAPVEDHRVGSHPEKRARHVDGGVASTDDPRPSSRPSSRALGAAQELHAGLQAVLAQDAGLRLLPGPRGHEHRVEGPGELREPVLVDSNPEAEPYSGLLQSPLSACAGPPAAGGRAVSRRRAGRPPPACGRRRSRRARRLCR